MKTRFSIVAAIILVPSVLASTAVGQVAVDGMREKLYGAAIASQNSTTGFGDSNLGIVDVANGSELDNCHARIDGGVPTSSSAATSKAISISLNSSLTVESADRTQFAATTLMSISTVSIDSARVPLALEMA